MYVTLPDSPAAPVGQWGEAKHSIRLRSPIHQQPVSPGAALFRDGDEARWLYKVVTGVLRLSSFTESGRRQVIAFVYPGEFVGFPCCGVHQCDCEALVPGWVQPFPAAALTDQRGDPETHAALVTAALREIRAMQEHFVTLGRKSASERLAAFLSALASRAGAEVDGVTHLHLPMCRADIADFLGLTTETVSRGMTHLRQAGIIELDDPQNLRILDRSALDEAAEND